MGGRWAICPWNKKEKDGRLKKKDWQTPIFLMHFFGAHLSGIPTNDWLMNFSWEKKKYTLVFFFFRFAEKKIHNFTIWLNEWPMNFIRKRKNTIPLLHPTSHYIHSFIHFPPGPSETPPDPRRFPLIFGCRDLERSETPPFSRRAPASTSVVGISRVLGGDHGVESSHIMSRKRKDPNPN